MFLGARPRFLNGVEVEFGTQSDEGTQAMAEGNWFEAIVVAKRYWSTKYCLLREGNGCKEAAWSILWFISCILIFEDS